jgi:hypothetical protein
MAEWAFPGADGYKRALRSAKPTYAEGVMPWREAYSVLRPQRGDAWRGATPRGASGRPSPDPCPLLWSGEMMGTRAGGFRVREEFWRGCNRPRYPKE